MLFTEKTKQQQQNTFLSNWLTSYDTFIIFSFIFIILYNTTLNTASVSKTCSLDSAWESSMSHVYLLKNPLYSPDCVEGSCHKTPKKPQNEPNNKKIRKRRLSD